MIIGMGVDLVDIADMERRVSRKTLLRVFSEAERDYADQHPLKRAQILAGRWAAKEAFAKALGTGIRAEWPLAEIEVVPSESGMPVIALGPSMRHLVPAGARIHVSITHTESAATAFVIIEQE